MITLLQGIGVLLPLLVSVAYLTLAERKTIAAIQRRKGPNVVGIVGLFQPFADGLKLTLKEQILPSSANSVIFLFAPVVTFTLALVFWAALPFVDGAVFCDIHLGTLYVFAISSLGVYGVIMAGG